MLVTVLRGRATVTFSHYTSPASLTSSLIGKPISGTSFPTSDPDAATSEYLMRCRRALFGIPPRQVWCLASTAAWSSDQV